MVGNGMEKHSKMHCEKENKHHFCEHISKAKKYIEAAKSNKHKKCSTRVSSLDGVKGLISETANTMLGS